MTFVIVMGFHQIIVVMNDVKRHTYIHTFNTENILPVMDTQPAHMHLKKDAIPHACHTPIPSLEEGG